MGVRKVDRLKQRRNHYVKNAVSAVPKLEARDTDWVALRKHSEAKKQAPLTNLSVTGERDVFGRKWPGSPCYNSKKVDYTFHRVLPALTYDSNPEFAKVWATTSPRWGNTKLRESKFPAKEPWKFKKPKKAKRKQYYTRVRNGKRQRVKMPKR